MDDYLLKAASFLSVLQPNPWTHFVLLPRVTCPSRLYLPPWSLEHLATRLQIITLIIQFLPASCYYSIVVTNIFMPSKNVHDWIRPTFIEMFSAKQWNHGMFVAKSVTDFSKFRHIWKPTSTKYTKRPTQPHNSLRPKQSLIIWTR